MTRATELGMSNSPSFRRLVDRLAALHGVVYLTAKQVVQSRTLRVIDGTLQHRITVAGSCRLLYRTVTPYSGSRPTRIIAHELQHAIEVLESTATSEREIDDLFERIGVRTDARTFETAAALAAEGAVAKEPANGTRHTIGSDIASANREATTDTLTQSEVDHPLVTTSGQPSASWRRTYRYHVLRKQRITERRPILVAASPWLIPHSILRACV